MSRSSASARAILAALVMTAAAAAAQPAAAQPAADRSAAPAAPAASAPDDPTRLGEVRGDTLFVARDRLVAVALERNELLRASGALVDAAGARAAGAWSGFLPRVSVGEYFLRSDDALMAFGFKLNNRNVTPADFDPARLNDPGETNNWVTRLQLLQPIFNGGMEWNAKAAADAASRAAAFDHARARETVALQAVQAYEGLVLALSYGDVVEAAIASAEAHERQARSLFEAEMATEADLLQARVFLSGLRQQHIIVTNHVAMAGEMIRLLTAIETPLVLAAAGAPPLDPAAAIPAAPAAEVSARSDLEARRLEAAAAGKLVGVATGAMLPHVNLNLQRDFYSQASAFGGDAKSWGLGLYATWDLFKGLENISALRAAKAQRRAADHRFDFELRRARHEAQQAWRDAAASRARVDVAREAVQAARASLRIVANQYREGLASMVDLLDVQAAATKAEGDLVQANHDFRVDLARLAYAAGVGLTEGGIQ